VYKFLTSYHYYKSQDLGKIVAATKEPVLLFADSGAFSAASQGAEVDIRAYGKWLTKWSSILTVASNLDVIGDHQASMKNQRELEAMGHNVLPVFHVGSPFDQLEKLCEEYPYVALGGMVPYSTANLGPWLVKCFRIASKYNTCFHGFGQTRREYLEDFPFYSVDSSAWGKSFMFGTLELWDEKTKRFTNIKHSDQSAIYKNADLLRLHGGDPEMFLDKTKYKRAHAVKVAAVAWMRFEKHLQQKHHGVKLRNTNTDKGFRLYLAETTSQTIETVIEGFHLYLANTGMPNVTDAASVPLDTIYRETE
jgi:hypothetical protein